MARGMSPKDEYVYCVIFGKDGEVPTVENSLYGYGPYTNKGVATRMINQEEGRWNQHNGRILRAKLEWEEVG